MYTATTNLKKKNNEYIIRNVILNMNTPFKLDDIVKLLEKENVFDLQLTTSIMSELSDVGMLTYLDGFFYVPKNLFTYI